MKTKQKRYRVRYEVSMVADVWATSEKKAIEKVHNDEIEMIEDEVTSPTVAYPL